MEKFKISHIQELFTADVERFHSLTQHHVTQLLHATSPEPESLAEALRQCHTLKGLAGTVEAWGLSCLGADFEKLLELAASRLENPNQREEANRIFEFIIEHGQDWYVMNQFTCMDMLPQAWDIYLGLRTIMDERWPRYLPPPATGEVSPSQYVRLSEPWDQAVGAPATQASKTGPTPDLDVCGISPETIPSTPKQEQPFVAPATKGCDVSGEQLVSPPPLLRVTPPALRKRAAAAQDGAAQRDGVAAEPTYSKGASAPNPPLSVGIEDRDVKQSGPILSGDVSAKTDNAAHGEVQTGAPKPLRVVPPTLRRRTEIAVAKTEKAEAATPVLPAGAVLANAPSETPISPEPFVAPATKGCETPGQHPVMPPLLRVSPPALKRREHKLGQAEVTTPVVPAEAVPSVELSATTPPPQPFVAPATKGCEVPGELPETPAVLPSEAVIEASGVVRLTESASVESAGPAAGAVAGVDAELVGFFIADTREQIEIIEQAVLRWEKVEGRTVETEGDSTELAQQRLACVQAAQRGFHTIKGAGNSIGLTAVAASVHEVESFLEGVASRGAAGSQAVFAFLLGAVDQLRGFLTALGQNSGAEWRQEWGSLLAGLVDAGVAKPKSQRVKRKADTAKPAVTPGMQTAGAESADAQPDGAESLLKIEPARLHQLVNLIGEMVVDRARLARKLEQLGALHRALAERNGALTGSVQNFQQQFEFNLMQNTERVREEGERGTRNTGRGAQGTDAGGGAAGADFSELEFDRYDQFNVLARSLVEISHDIEQLNAEVMACLDSFAAEQAQFAQTSRELQGRVTGLSLVPVRSLFPRLERAFRDACRVESKTAELQFAGGEALLDKVLVDKVYGPLLHLVRNAVAHGIEDVATREQAKKPALGCVRLSAAQLSNQIVLQLSDDGAGVDAAAVRKRAIAKGWLSDDAPELSPEQVAHFIFQPGFSTADKVTSVSGRGIGLDVVRSEVEVLNGSVELRYEAGKGATWTLRLPLTLSISEAILAEVGGAQFAFPLNFIEYGVVLDGPLVQGADGRETYVMAGTGDPTDEAPEVDGTDTSHFARDAVTGVALPVVRLARLFSLPETGVANRGLIVSVGDRRVLVLVDAVLRRQEIVVKELDALMAQHPLLNGASLDAEGRVLPILNLPSLLKFAEQAPLGTDRAAVGWEQVPREARANVLVVDDSLSVRKVQERFLRDLGCSVTVAKDGLEALDRLREKRFDLVFTDLEMPRLNGYELISEVRGNPAWAAVPLVVISSRGADKYITKAMNLGASTFLTKPFTQDQLRQVLEHYAGVEKGR